MTWSDFDPDDRDAPQDIDLDDEDAGDVQACPACGRFIHEEADKCPYCGLYVLPGTAGADGSPAARRARGWFWPVMVAILTATILVMWHGLR